MIRACLPGLLMLGLATGALAEDTAPANPAGTPLVGAPLVGDWARRDGGTRIRISPCGDAVCAVNSWVRDPAGDEKPGDTLVMTLTPRSPTVLSGHAYDKRRDMTYSMTISFGSAGMRTEGCFLLGLLCRTTEWTRLP